MSAPVSAALPGANPPMDTWLLAHVRTLAPLEKLPQGADAFLHGLHGRARRLFDPSARLHRQARESEPPVRGPRPGRA
jgi:hypothetical protein